MRGLLSRLMRHTGERATRSHAAPEEAASVQVDRYIDLRIARGLFEEILRKVEDFSRGEEAGFLLCGQSVLCDRITLLAREWITVPDDAVSRNKDGVVLGWSSTFNSFILQRALELEAAPLLIHSHGSARPSFSIPDRRKERDVFPVFSRILSPVPTGSVLLGKGDAAGSFWIDGRVGPPLRRITVIGDHLEHWWAVGQEPRTQPRRRLARQAGAIGSRADALLANATVGILGISGGGSHVAQQLAYQGHGHLIPIDREFVDETNTGRLVGSGYEDIDVTPKTAIARRLARAVDPKIEVVEVRDQFPSKESIAALKRADVIVACLDSFHARESINAFARRYLIPLVDIGMQIETKDEKLLFAQGQVVVALPGEACLRCTLVTNAALEREKRERPPGYDRNPDAGDPQVVSMNGVLASEACNSVLDLITGFSAGARGAKWWQYDGRTGRLEPAALPPRWNACPACIEEGKGDPSGALEAWLSAS